MHPPNSGRFQFHQFDKCIDTGVDFVDISIDTIFVDFCLK